jgi:hypothetical protein
VTAFDLLLVLLTLAGCGIGGLSMYLAQGARAAWGRRLAVAALLCMGATGLIAADARANGLVPLGLLAGLMTVMMLWHGPELEAKA